MFFQIGLFTGVLLSAILGVSFGSLATLFTKDPEVLGIVKTGVLVCKRTYVLICSKYFFSFESLCKYQFPFDIPNDLCKICHSLSVLANL